MCLGIVRITMTTGRKRTGERNGTGNSCQECSPVQHSKVGGKVGGSISTVIMHNHNSSSPHHTTHNAMQRERQQAETAFLSPPKKVPLCSLCLGCLL